MVPQIWKCLIIFSLSLAHGVQADPYRLSFENGVAVHSSQEDQKFDNALSAERISTNDEQDILGFKFPSSEVEEVEVVQTATDKDSGLSDVLIAVPSECAYADLATIEEVLKNDADSQALGSWLTSASTTPDLEKMVEHRLQELNNLPGNIQSYVLGYSGDFQFYAVDDSGLLVHLESPTAPDASSCLRWMWIRLSKQAYILTGVRVQDMPDFIVQWIRKNPGQTTFNVVRGVVFFVPGALYGPVLYWLGWTSLGVAGGSFAAFLHATLYGAAIPAGGWFAILTSAAMGGYGAPVLGGLAAGTVGLGGVYSLGREFWRCYWNETLPIQ